MHNCQWVVWCTSKKGAEEICSFELSRKEIFSNLRLTGIEQEYWMGTEIGKLGGYSF